MFLFCLFSNSSFVFNYCLFIFLELLVYFWKIFIFIYRVKMKEDQSTKACNCVYTQNIYKISLSVLLSRWFCVDRERWGPIVLVFAKLSLVWHKDVGIRLWGLKNPIFCHFLLVIKNIIHFMHPNQSKLPSESNSSRLCFSKKKKGSKKSSS